MSTGSEDVDRISDLPEPIITAILSFLPTKSAVATRVLAKSWRFRWTEVTAFDFSDELWPETRGGAVPPLTFLQFVNLVFANHTGPIDKLRLRWKFEKVRSVYLNIWLNSAIDRNLRVLDLCTVSESLTGTLPENHRLPIYLPDALYTSGTLETVKLRGHFRINPPCLVRLPKLAVLELCFVVFESDESLEKLVSACPLLESLKMEWPNLGPKQIKVSSSSLKHFKFVFIRNYPKMELVIDTPSLEHLVLTTTKSMELTCSQVMPVNEVDIDTTFGFYKSPGVARMLQACGGAKVMRLSEGAIQDLFCADFPFPARFGRLTKLVVKFSCVYWSNMWDFIDRCNNLQVLDIFLVASKIRPDRLRPPLHIPGCLSSSLKHVFIRYYDEVGFAMLKFLLNHGLHIERVTLFHPFYTHDMKKYVLNEVSKLSRASATCEISWLRPKIF